MPLGPTALPDGGASCLQPSRHTQALYLAKLGIDIDDDKAGEDDADREWEHLEADAGAAAPAGTVSEAPHGGNRAARPSDDVQEPLLTSYGSRVGDEAGDDEDTDPREDQ